MLKVRAPTLLVVGEKDVPDGMLEPAAALHARLPGSVLETVPGLEHALAEEPGTDPAAQTAGAAVADRIVADWFGRRLQAVPDAGLDLGVVRAVAQPVLAVADRAQALPAEGERDRQRDEAGDQADAGPGPAERAVAAGGDEAERAADHRDRPSSTPG